MTEVLDPFSYLKDDKCPRCKSANFVYDENKHCHCYDCDFLADAKEEKRDPMLSDRDVKSMQDSYAFLFSGHEELNSEAWLIGALDTRKAYEAKITSGELMVVKTVKLDNKGNCTCGSFQWMPKNTEGKSMVTPFCSNCGAKIIE